MGGDGGPVVARVRGVFTFWGPGYDIIFVVMKSGTRGKVVVVIVAVIALPFISRG